MMMCMVFSVGEMNELVQLRSSIKSQDPKHEYKMTHDQAMLVKKMIKYWCNIGYGVIV